MLLVVIGLLPLCTFGQDLSNSQWYFGNSTQWLSFAGRATLNTGQVTPYGAAGSLVATDYRSGNLLFYSDGSQLIGANNTVIASNLPGDPSLPQPVHATPIPGENNAFYLFFIDNARSLQYARFDADAQTLGPRQPLNIGGTAAGVMEVIRGTSGNGYVYWLVVPLQGNSASYSLVRVTGPTAPAVTQVTTTTTLPDFNPVSIAFSEETGILAVGNSATTQDFPVLLYGFLADPDQPDPAQLVNLGSLEDAGAANGAITGLAWLDSFLFVAKEVNASGSNGGLFRYDFTDYDPAAGPPPAITIQNASFAQHLDLRTGPNDQVYLLYQATAGGASLVGKVEDPTSARPDFTPEIVGNIDFRGSRFSRSAFPAFRELSLDFDYTGACTQSPTYFYPIFTEDGPERVEWYVNGALVSREIQPSIPLDPAGQAEVALRAYFPGDVREVTQSITVNEGAQLDIQPEYIICPNADSTITLTIGGQPVPAGYTVTWYKPLSVEEVGKQSIEVANEITVAAMENQRLPNGGYPEAGTYYVVVNTGQCEVYAPFEVIVYNDETSKSNVWYFGNGAGLDFNSQPPVATNDSQMRGANEAPEGTTISVDANSDPLFYTNGVTLWTRDANNDGIDDIAPGTLTESLGGSLNASQNSLLMPHPNDATQHYVFTISNDPADFRALRYSVADLKGNGTATPPAPDLEEAKSSGEYVRARLLFPEVAEKLAGTSTSGWVIAHELGNNRFISYPVTAAGIGSPVFSQAGSVIDEPQSEGYMVLAPNDTLLAVALPNSGGGNSIEIFKFNAQSGKVEDEDHITVPIEGSGSIYGLAFSPSSERLFFTLTGSTSTLHQLSIDSAFRAEETINSLVEVARVNEALGALQLGPDRALYVARNGSGFVGVVQAPDDSLTTANASTAYRADGVDLEGNTSRLGLPNLAQPRGSAVQDPSVMATSVCVTDDSGQAEVTVSGTRRYNNEQYIFEIWGGNNLGTMIQSAGPGSDSTSTFTLPPGDYKVVLKLVACNLTYPTDYPDESAVEMLFSVYAKPEAAITNALPVTLCEDQSITLEGQVSLDGVVVADPTGYQFIWSNNISGAILGSTQTQVVTEAGVYRLDVIGPTGCQADPYFIDVVDARPEADLGDDITICVGETLPRQTLVANGVPANHSISWSRSINFGPFNELITGTPPAEQSLADINTDQAASYRYLIEVRSNDPAQACFRIDTMAINIVPAPIVTLRAINNDCNGNAELLAEVQGGSGDFIFTFSNGVTNTTGRTSITESGTYSVTITDEATSGNGCPTASQEINVDVLNGIQDLEIIVEPSCRVPGVEALNELTAQTSYNGVITYVWYNITDGQEVKLEASTATIMVPDGRYRVTATSDAGCNGAAATAEADVASIPELVIPNYNICRENPELSSVTVTIPTDYVITGWFRYDEGVRRSIPGGYVMNITEVGKYEVEVEGCSDPAIFDVVLSCTPQLALPNAINPNSVNPENRVFSILNPHMAEFMTNIEVLIFNRWGEVIWQSNDNDFEWDGRRKGGDLVPMGNYPYLIRYRNLYGNDKATINKIYGSIFVMD